MIIGFAGKAGAGKDTAGNYLKLKKWQHYQFARPLKMTVAKMLGLPLTAMEDRELKETPLAKPILLTEDDATNFMAIVPATITGHEMANNIIEAFDGKEINTIRELLQFVGTDVGRDLISETIWVDAAKQALSNLSKSGNVVITDVRFENELNLIKSMNGKVARIDRDLEENNQKEQHASEKIDFATDYVIINNTYKQKLYDQLEEILTGGVL